MIEPLHVVDRDEHGLLFGKLPQNANQPGRRRAGVGRLLGVETKESRPQSALLRSR
jgi:hypothetical protein